MPPLNGNIGGDDKRHHDARPSDDRSHASKVKVQMQSVTNPSALVISTPTIASAELEGQQSSGFHPSVLAS